MFTGAALVSGAGGGNTGMLEGLVIEKLNGWDIEKRWLGHIHYFLLNAMCNVMTPRASLMLVFVPVCRRVSCLF